MRRIASLLPVLALIGAASASAADYGGQRQVYERHYSRTSSRPVVPAEERIIPFSARLPTCEDGRVLGEVTSNFRSKEANFWLSPVEIVAFERVHAVADRPWGADFVPRRFCSATAYLSDGRRHRVDYSVREAFGTLGVTWDVNWCVSGYDRNLAYAPDCRAARP